MNRYDDAMSTIYGEGPSGSDGGLLTEILVIAIACIILFHSLKGLGRLLRRERITDGQRFCMVFSLPAGLVLWAFAQSL